MLNITPVLFSHRLISIDSQHRITGYGLVFLGFRHVWMIVPRADFTPPSLLSSPNTDQWPCPFQPALTQPGVEGGSPREAAEVQSARLCAHRPLAPLLPVFPPGLSEDRFGVSTRRAANGGFNSTEVCKPFPPRWTEAAEHRNHCRGCR